MASFHNWTGDEEIGTQVPQFLNEDNAATQEKLDTKLSKTETAAAAIKDGAGNIIVDTYAKKTDISGMVKSVNGKEPDANGNVNVANMTGASDSAAGKAGLVPAPAAGMQNKFLCSDATWKDAGGLSVGHEFFTTNPNIPAGCIPLLGGEYSRTVYADLWAWVQTQEGYLIGESVWQAKATANGGNVPFYSKGDGSTTFRVPSLKCWVKGASSISEVSEYLAAGLPNIEGQLGLWGTEKRYSTTSGAFSTNNSELDYGAGHSKDGGLITDFNASLSNPIYGSSDTVQPPSIVGMWLVKAYGTVTNVGSTDVSNIAQGLTELENRVTPIANGGTGATSAISALSNLGILDAIVNASVSGKTITFTKKDNTKFSIDTQDTNNGIVAALLKQNGYIKFANGLILQWGKTPELTFNSTTTITYSLPLATTLYINAFMRGGGRDKCVQLPQILSQTSTSAQIYITWATDSAGYYDSVTWLAIGK